MPKRKTKQERKEGKIITEKPKASIKPGTTHLSTFKEGGGRMFDLSPLLREDFESKGLKFTSDKPNFEHPIVPMSIAHQNDKIFLAYPTTTSPKYTTTKMHNLMVRIPEKIKRTLDWKFKFRTEFPYTKINTPDKLIIVIDLNKGKPIATSLYDMDEYWKE